MSTNWSVYLLYNPKTRRTYIGSTTDVYRRLRQHNRELVGGAKSTRSGAPDWRLQYHLSGFPNRSSACRWEKIMKVRARGLEARSCAFVAVASGFCPPYKNRKSYQPPVGLELHYHG